MATLSALSAAVRHQLLAGEPAPLPGFGTFRRVRTPARHRAEASDTFRPPRETIRLVLGDMPDSMPLAIAIAREMGLPVSGGAQALRQSTDQLEGLLSARGDVTLDGVGIVRRTDRGLLFAAHPALVEEINAPYPASAPRPPADEPPADEPSNDALAMTPAIGAATGDALPEDASEDLVPDFVATDDPASDAPLSDADAPPGETLAPVTGAPGAVPETTSGPGDLAEADLAEEEPETDDADLFAFLDGEPLGDDTLHVGPDSLAQSLRDEPAVSPEAAASSEEASATPDAHDDEAPALLEGETETAPETAPEDSDDLGAGAERDPDGDAAFSPRDESGSPEPGLVEPEGEEPDQPDPVDDLLAGIWSTGTPVASNLGTALGASPGEESLRMELPEIEHTPRPVPSDSVRRQPAPSRPPEAEASTPPASDVPGSAPPAVGASAAAPVASALPEGKHSAKGDDWNRFVVAEAPPEPEPPDPFPSRLPWIVGAVVLLTLLALFALLFWGSLTTPPEEEGFDSPPQAEASASRSGVANTSGDASDDALDPDAVSSGESDPAALAAASGGGLGAASGASAASDYVPPARPATDAESTPPLSSPTAAVGTPAGVARPPTRTQTRPVTALPEETFTPGDPIPAPDLRGLSATLRAALAGDRPIDPDAGGYTWIVSSTSDRSAAEAAARRYREAGFRALAIPGGPDGRTRVAVGQFANQRDALEVRDRLPADVRSRSDIWTLNLADV